MTSNWRGSLAGYLAGGIWSVTGFTTFFKGVFTRAFTDWQFWDLLLAFGIIASIFAVILVFKDVFDGGKFSLKEKQKARNAFLVMAGLLIIGWLVASYLATPTTLQAVKTNLNGDAGEFKTTNGAYWYTTASPHQEIYKDIGLQLGTPYVVPGSANDSNYHGFRMFFNQSWITFTEMKLYRAINASISDDGITRVKLIHYDANGVGSNTLLDSSIDTANFDLTDKGTTTELNITWTLANIISWDATYLFNDPNDNLHLDFLFSSDFDETGAVTFNFYWGAIGNDIYYMGVMILWACAGYIPLAMMLNLNTLLKGGYNKYKKTHNSRPRQIKRRTRRQRRR